jgi:RNA polymerase sigma factor (TIGR02999 family)
MEDANEAKGQLFAQVYDELRVIANAHFRDQPAGHTLQPTVLIHEAFLRMADAPVKDRAHFFALASKVMRQLLVDHCRRGRALKRGGGWAQVTLGATPTPEQGDLLGVLDLDAALNRLADLDARKARIVELKFFGGLETSEIAALLDVSARTIEADWAMARAWLKKDLA